MTLTVMNLWLFPETDAGSYKVSGHEYKSGFVTFVLSDVFVSAHSDAIVQVDLRVYFQSGREGARRSTNRGRSCSCDGSWRGVTVDVTLMIYTMFAKLLRTLLE